MDLSEVQILVVVASIQMRTLKTEVENGFMTTAVGHELVGPKRLLNCKNFELELQSSVSLEVSRKGKWSKFHYHASGCYKVTS